MMGKQHMIVNSAVVTTGCVLCHSALSSVNCLQQDVAVTISQYFYPSSVTGFVCVLWSILLFAAMLFGSLLPDIDSKTSMLGKYIYIPVEHRTWTHTIWAVGILFMLGRVHAVFGAICVGYFLHLLVDSISAAGICWFYPFQTYRRYNNGAFVAKNHKVKLYYAGKLSEKVLVVLILVVCAVICVVNLR